MEMSLILLCMVTENVNQVASGKRKYVRDLIFGTLVLLFSQCQSGQLWEDICKSHPHWLAISNVVNHHHMNLYRSHFSLSWPLSLLLVWADQSQASKLSPLQCWRRKPLRLKRKFSSEGFYGCFSAGLLSLDPTRIMISMDLFIQCYL